MATDPEAIRLAPKPVSRPAAAGPVARSVHWRPGCIHRRHLKRLDLENAIRLQMSDRSPR